MSTLSRVCAAAMVALPLCDFATVARAQLVIGHRGASYAAPENTLAAFRLAWKQGADGIEGDFYLSSDKQIVCIHDADTERVAGVKRVVSETTFAELRTLDVGSWKGSKWKSERIPTLAEVLATAPRGKMVFIEIKCGPEIVKPLEEVVKASDVAREQLVIISFSADVIAECERRMPDLKTYWLTGYEQREDKTWRPTPQEVADAMHRSSADGLGSQALPEFVDERFLSALQDLGVDDFSVWTVDDPATAHLYKRRGAWSITTNRPRYIRKRLQAAENSAVDAVP